MILSLAVALIFATKVAFAHQPVTISTTSGSLLGAEEDGVMSFKGIRFAQPPTGSLRWLPPVAFVSNATQNATVLGPSCVQQFAFATATLIEPLFNNPEDPPDEDEDCLFLNVWAPSCSSYAPLKPVVFYIYGGSFAFGTASLPEYDGTSIASNQDIVVVTFNYRTNVFGFPGAPDLPLQENNLGMLDQELALQWVQSNIQKFGGDPNQITIMGQSAGGISVSTFIVRHPVNPPFRAAIIFSGAAPDSSPKSTKFDAFNNFSIAMGCSQAPGPARLTCLRAVSAVDIRAYTNGPTAGDFRRVVDDVTDFEHNLEIIRSGNTAQVPLLAGTMQDDGTLFTVGETNLTAFLEAQGTKVGELVSADLARSLYPGQNDTTVIANVFRDLTFLCVTSLWAQAFVEIGISSVFRYEYGAAFPDFQLFPGAGAWHSTEVPEFFGTYNAETATHNEKTLSKSFQTAIANFIKNPNKSPAPHWPNYVPGNDTQTLARLAYHNNVDLGNFVDAVTSDSQDSTCATWNMFLDF
ncbi:Carboxylesterase [Rhodocollybia butyracea]|uniref:Carboxylic ester hydrolase n=1 Tax=Rhodocollybia butyracea TaxID=206335 RepID=A0A9P5U5U7_9AGAR|nr:Carboxylesterase [Rhodocollybia butyracea]